MKKYIIRLLIILFLFNQLSIALIYAEQDIILKKFIVTAYYSPLPNQNFYLRWNFDDEVVLNWEWKRWASWKSVYSWMIAAPKSYKFGTKIYLDWIWIWTVDDRWWAIVGSWSRGYDGDRLDVWMWYWEEWLKRALTWWKRVVYWRVISKEEEDVLPFFTVEQFKIWKIDFNSLKNAQLVWKNNSPNSSKVSKYVVPEFFWEKSDTESIKFFQKILTNLWYYSWAIDGKYSNKIENSIMSFQLDNKLINNQKDRAAWYYWPKTKELLNTKYLSFLNEEKIKQDKIKKENEAIALLDKQATNIVKSLWTPKENDVWSHVRKLQKTLKLLWYFEWKDTAIYWKLTKESILKYQIDNWLVTCETDKWAWMIGEKTLWKIKDDLKIKIKLDKDIIKELLS